jgi:hypothetical protein
MARRRVFEKCEKIMKKKAKVPGKAADNTFKRIGSLTLL